MLYALQIKQKVKPTKTYIFGTRLLMTLGVEILGKTLDADIFKPFTSIDEIIAFKASIRKAPKGNVPILLFKSNNKIQISGRLFKSGGLSHDPNIGALSLIAAVLRKLKWDKRIEITQHGLQQKHVSEKNKFVFIANMLGIDLERLTVPNVKTPQDYWRYNREGEKLGTIFIHIVVENFTESYSIFENHAGCEKGYFQKPQGKCIPLAKFANRKAYKAGDKRQIVFIPDLVLLNNKTKEIITIEGKKYENKKQGIAELNNYDSLDKLYLKKYYPNHKIVRTVVLYGSTNTQILEQEVGFLLNADGQIVLGIKAPSLFIKAIRNLLDFWQ